MIGLYQVRSREKAAATSQAGTSPHKLQLRPRSSAFICGHHVFPNCAQNAQVCTKWLRFVNPNQPASLFPTLSVSIRVHLWPTVFFRKAPCVTASPTRSSFFRPLPAIVMRPPLGPNIGFVSQKTPASPLASRTGNVTPKTHNRQGTLRHPARIWLRFAKMPLRVTTLPQGSSFFRALHIPLRPRVLPLKIPRK